MSEIYFKYVDNMCVVIVDAVEYAVIDDCQRDDIDEQLVMEWAENSSVDCDHLSSAYVPSRLNKYNFGG